MHLILKLGGRQRTRYGRSVVRGHRDGPSVFYFLCTSVVDAHTERLHCHQSSFYVYYLLQRGRCAGRQKQDGKGDVTMHDA